MTRIEAIDVMIADVPTIRPHVLAMTTIQSQALVLVFIRREDGITGVGEATTIGGLAYGEESPESVRVNIQTYFDPVLKTCDADDVTATMAKLDTHIVGNRFAKCAVETALLDALGQARGLPIGKLVGTPVADRIEVAWALASGDTARDIEEGERVLTDQRHRHFKLKIGKRDVAEDCAHVAAIAEAFAGRASVRVDVNQAWTREQARDGAARLQDAGVVLIEQPLFKSDTQGMADLAEEFDIAVMPDEALTGPVSATVLAEAGAGDAFSVKISQSGGLTRAREVVEIARRHGIGLYGGTMLEGPVGTIASAHLFNTIDNLEWGTELFGPLLLTEDILLEPLGYGDFGLAIPSGPGLGIALDLDKLEHFART